MSYKDSNEAVTPVHTVQKYCHCFKLCRGVLVVGTDETQVKLFESSAEHYVLRKNINSHQSDRGDVIAWDCFACSGPGRITMTTRKRKKKI